MTIPEILQRYRRVAMVGLSANPMRPSHFVAIYLLHNGFDVTPVNPREPSILGRTSYASLADVPGPLEIVDVFRDPSALPGIASESVAAGAKVLWMQLGIVNQEAADSARHAGLEVVMDRCLKIEHARHAGGLSLMGLHSGLITARQRKR